MKRFQNFDDILADATSSAAVQWSLSLLMFPLRVKQILTPQSGAIHSQCQRHYPMILRRYISPKKTVKLFNSVFHDPL